MAAPDYEPTDELIREWIAEYDQRPRDISLAQFIARKAARHGADIELRIWSDLLAGVGYIGTASRMERERRPPPPKATIRQDGYVYHLAPPHQQPTQQGGTH